jgi:hypothetical protein
MHVCTPCHEPAPCPSYDVRGLGLNVKIPHLDFDRKAGKVCLARIQNSNGCSACPQGDSVTLEDGKIISIK